MRRDNLKTETRKLVHVTLSQRLMDELTRLGAYESKPAAKMAAYLLECILPIAHAETTYRLIPSKFDQDSATCSLQPALTMSEKELLQSYAREGGVSGSEQLCQVWWLGVGGYEKYQRVGLVLRREEFIRRITEDIKARREELLQT